MTKADPDHSIRSTDEIHSLIQQLTRAEWRRLMVAASRLASSLPGSSAEDVLQEALDAALTGRRICPRHVPVVTFLANAMRSELNNLRKKAERTDALDEVSEDLDGLVVESAEDAVVWMNDLVARVQRIAAASKDGRVLMVLEGRAEGMSREELRDMLSIPWTEFESLERQIRRLRDRDADEERTA
ncbi:DNA-directed RNA polymerase specialized sigma24 family protein [Luteibacter jiangsuensis]|uniref:DNA-directed RNA polymerase specialized sigma24 family protein n=1 Tax=Luteibacter jiangsuensis TaxID=637577 RepID=A0ABT9SWP3_9GAMM|nr:hypothetical protein [Luteibacter jiangsuensis]MDQ0009431.1 DNA-directed RNA polymerase specialized sigma24 family protein [Luteibacter jiangsuensis]